MTISQTTPLFSSQIQFYLNGASNKTVNQKETVAASSSTTPVAGLITDLAEITQRSGLVPRHMADLQRVATENQCIFAFRPVDPLSTQLIAEGHPTKNFHIKGKSASWGPMAGFIPVDQHFSKLEGSDPDKLIKFNQKTQECLEKNHAIPGHLTISAERLQYLVSTGLIDVHGSQNNKILYAKGPSGQEYQFNAEFDMNGNVLNVLHQGKHIEVLCDPETGIPYTADYDLLCTAPSMAHYGAQDKLPVLDVAYAQYLERFSQYKHQVSPPLQKEAFYASMDKDKGNITQRENELIKKLNQAMGCKPGREVVHHCQDAANPTTNPDSNYPVTFFLPQPLDWIPETVLMATNEDALACMIKAVKEGGFYIPVNPLWNEKLTSIRHPSFEQACNSLNEELNKNYQTQESRAIWYINGLIRPAVFQIDLV